MSRLLSQKMRSLSTHPLLSVYYFVTWEPLPVDNSSTMNEQDFILTEENAYAILNEDGTYDIYLYGEYLETVTSLKYYDSSLPIYTRNNSN